MVGIIILFEIENNPTLSPDGNGIPNRVGFGAAWDTVLRQAQDKFPAGLVFQRSENLIAPKKN